MDVPFFISLALYYLGLGAGPHTGEPAGFPTLVALEDVVATSTLAPGGAFRYDAHQVVSPRLERVDPADPRPADRDAVAGVRYLSAWCEGQPGAGIGEAVTITLAEPVVIESLRIAAGVWLSEALFRANDHVAELAVETDDGRTVVARPPDARAFTEVALGGAPVRRLTLRITRAERRAGAGSYDDACLSAVSLRGVQIVDGVPAPALAALRRFAADWSRFEAQALADVPADRSAARRDVVRLVAFPFTIRSAALAASGGWGEGEGDSPDDPDRPRILASADAFMRACVLAERGPSPNPACPAPARWSDLQVVSAAGDTLVLELAERTSDVWPRWTLRWDGSAWRLVAEDFRRVDVH